MRQKTVLRVNLLGIVSLLVAALLPSIATSNGQTGRRRNQPTQSGQRKPETSNQRSMQEQITKPTAAWLLASPNPLAVTPVVSQQNGVNKRISADLGGTVTAKGADGTLFTLKVPKRALVDDVEIGITPVSSIQNLPFARGLVAAVQITPADVPLSRAATLIIEPAKPIPSTEQLSFASFAYREGGKEFHLYPLEADPSKITFNLFRFGGFGIAHATDAEQDSVRSRTPTDPTDRVFMQMQKLKRILRERRLRQTSAAVSVEQSWRIVKASFRESSTYQGSPSPNVIEMYREQANRLRELYDQQVMPKLKALKFDCRSNMMIAVREALTAAWGWMRAVDLWDLRDELTPEELTDEEKQAIIEQRLSREGLTGSAYDQRRAYYQKNIVITSAEVEAVERNRMLQAGYTEAEVAQLQQEFKAIRIEFQRLYNELDRLLKDILPKAYDRAYQCCVQEGKDFYLQMMDWAARTLALLGEEDRTSPEKRDECLCTIASVSSQAEQWRGTITYRQEFSHTENVVGEKGHSETFQKESLVATFDVNIEKRITLDGRAIVNNAIVKTNASYYERYTSTGTRACNKPLRRTTDLSGDSESAGSVGIRIAPDMSYRVYYQVPTINMEGSYEVSWHLEGDCRNPFMTKSGGDRKPMEKLIGAHAVEIEGTLDPKNPRVLTGTKTETVERNGGTMTLTVTWNLIRCQTRR